MSYFASVAGLPIVEGSLLIPNVGVWTADVYLASSQSLSGPVSVVVGNLTLAGTVFRSQAYGGQTRVRLVGGAGGWRNAISAQGYGAATGVRLSTVLLDAAKAAGERLIVASDMVIGTAYARAADIASDALWQAVSQDFIDAWYVDPSGITQTKAWPSSTITTPFVVTDQNPEQGVVTVATEDYASWMPGVQFTSPSIQGQYTSVGVHYVWTSGGRFRLEVLTGADTLTGAIDAVVQKQIAPTKYFGRYDYSIENPTSTTIDATPKDARSGMPSLQNVPLLADSISSYVPPSGGACHIQFLDGVPNKPVCVWTEGAPTSARLLGGSVAVAREGDQVTISVAQWNAASPTAPSSGGPVTITNPMQATITAGSSTVTTQ